MTGLPFYEGFAPKGLRTFDACLESAEAVLLAEHENDKAARAWEQEQPVDVKNLIGEEVMSVAKHPHGWSIRFGSGASIVIPSGVTRDGVGVLVIEP